MTILHARAPVPFRGEENRTVRECVKFIRLIQILRWAPSWQLFVGACEADLFVDSNVLVLKSSTPSAPYCDTGVVS